MTTSSNIPNTSVDHSIILHLALGVPILGGLYLTSLSNYLLFHAFAEIFSIVVAFAIFVFAWNVRRMLDNHYLLFLGIVFLFIGLIDLLHTLSYKGMNIFPGADANMPTQLWIASRYLESSALLVAPVFIRRRLNIMVVASLYMVASILLLATIFSGHIFPTCFIEGTGLTPFKKISEYLICLILAAALLRLWQNRQHFDGKVLQLLIAAIVSTIISELAFTFYIDVYEFSNLVGHFFKIISFYLIYRAIIVTGLSHPLALLFRKLEQSNQELTTAKDELECRVEERTAELAQANDMLHKEIILKDEARVELQRSEARLRAIFNATEAVAFVLTDLADNPHIVEFSPGAEEIFGYNRSEILGHHISRIHKPGNVEQFPTVLERLRRGQRGFSGEITMVRKNGDRFPALLTITPVSNYKGEAVGLGVTVDITERKRAEEDLRLAKEDWEKTFDAIDDLIMILSPTLQIVQTNRKACELFGGTPAELRGRHCYQLFHGAEEPCAECPALKSLADSSLHSTEIYHDNLNKVFQVYTAPVLEEGRVDRITFFARDITDQKKLESQLRQAQKMEAIGTLAGGIAHDFNNILSAMIGFTELTLLNLPQESPVAKDLQVVLESGERAKRLVQQILSFSRQVDQERQPVMIHLIIKEALKLLRSSMPSTIKFKQDIDPEVGTVLADPTQIHQIIMNLCTNAYHAMRTKGGILAISLRATEIDHKDYDPGLNLQPGIYVQLEVSDTGHGMDERTKERIFEPYFTTKERGEGTGLGLAVVHGIVKNLGGLINVYSEPGRGTTFHVYLPCQETKRQKAKAEAAVIPRGKKERLLVVDDDKMIIDLEKRLLEELDYQVIAVTESEEALRIFQQDPQAIDLVVTDMTMPKLTGLELAKEFQALRPDIRIIMCTGFSELINEEQARAQGIQAFIMKPVVRKDLAQVVREVLDF